MANEAEIDAAVEKHRTATFRQMQKIMAEVIRDATDEVIGLREDVANLIAAAEQAMRALIELDGGDPTDETGWHDEMACQAWRALTVAIGIARGRR